MVGPPEFEGLHKDRRHRDEQEHCVPIREPLSRAPCPEHEQGGETEERRNPGAGEIESLRAEGRERDCERGDEPVERRGGVRRDAGGRVFEIVMADGAKWMLEHARDAGHSRIAIGIDESDAAIGEDVPALGGRCSQKDDRKNKKTGNAPPPHAAA